MYARSMQGGLIKLRRLLRVCNVFRCKRIRAQTYGHLWERGSLQDAIEKFTPGATAENSRNGRKALYSGQRYTILYDFGGNYFRIRDESSKSRRNFVDLDGNPVLNITEDGKQRGATNSEYETFTHFMNTDSEGR